MTARLDCPDCRSTLESTPGPMVYECPRCNERIHVLAAARDDLKDLANSDLPCAWIAQALLEIEP